MDDSGVMNREVTWRNILYKCEKGRLNNTNITKKSKDQRELLTVAGRDIANRTDGRSRRTATTAERNEQSRKERERGGLVVETVCSVVLRET